MLSPWSPTMYVFLSPYHCLHRFLEISIVFSYLLCPVHVYSHQIPVFIHTTNTAQPFNYLILQLTITFFSSIMNYTCTHTYCMYRYACNMCKEPNNRSYPWNLHTIDYTKHPSSWTNWILIGRKELGIRNLPPTISLTLFLFL